MAAHTKNGRKPEKRGGRAKTVATVAERLTRPLFAKRGFADGAVLTEWPRIVGDTIAGFSMPERIGFPPGKRTGGTLHLRVAPGGFAVELQHLEHQLIERINGYFGYHAVARVKIVQAPLPEPAPPPPPPLPELAPDEERAVAQATAPVDDPDLKERLESLGRAIRSREKKRKKKNPAS